MSIVREIVAGYARYLDRTGTAPTVLELGPSDGARFDRWLLLAVAPLGRNGRLNQTTVLGMRVRRVAHEEPMRFFREEAEQDGRPDSGHA